MLCMNEKENKPPKNTVSFYDILDHFNENFNMNKKDIYVNLTANRRQVTNSRLERNIQAISIDMPYCHNLIL